MLYLTTRLIDSRMGQSRSARQQSYPASALRNAFRSPTAAREHQTVQTTCRRGTGSGARAGTGANTFRHESLLAVGVCAVSPIAHGAPCMGGNVLGARPSAKPDESDRVSFAEAVPSLVCSRVRPSAPGTQRTMMRRQLGARA
jgi:hypothetical protein